VFLAVAGWAFPGAFVRWMPHFGVGALVGLRLSVAFCALAPLAFASRYRQATFQALRSPTCWLLSTFMLLYYAAATPAFYYAPIGEVALVIASAPLFAVFIRAIVHEPVTRNELLGAVMAVAGVAVMAYPSIVQAKIGGRLWIGIGLAIAAAIGAAFYAIGSRRLHLSGSSPGVVPQVLLSFLLGLAFLPFLALEPPEKLHSWTLAWLVPLGTFSTVMPTLAVAAAARRISVVIATLVNPICAVAANVVGALTLHEIPTTWTAFGGVLVIGAIYVAVVGR
jgi:inner membrane transporter RhtA